MSIFQSRYFRWFAGAFLLGAAVPPIATAIGRLKGIYMFDFTVGIVGKKQLSSTPAWIITMLACGLLSGTLGMGAAKLTESAHPKEADA